MKKILSFILIAILLICTPAYGEHKHHHSSTEEHVETQFKLNKSHASIAVGDTIHLRVKGKHNHLTWTSSNKHIATVKNGKVTGKHKGYVNIIVKDRNGNSATCHVHVTRRHTHSDTTVTIKNRYRVKKGKSIKIHPKFYGEKEKYKIYVSNSKIAKVKKNKITGKHHGTTIITLKTKSGIKVRAKLEVY